MLSRGKVSAVTRLRAVTQSALFAKHGHDPLSRPPLAFLKFAAPCKLRGASTGRIHRPSTKTNTTLTSRRMATSSSLCAVKRGTFKGRILYRVDKVILSRQSPVFAGLFSIPYDGSVSEELDGLPVVRLDDGFEAMGRLLRFWYAPS